VGTIGSFKQLYVLVVMMAIQMILFCSFSFASEKRVQFPKNFKWCVATAAHQIEGDNFNSDHYKWEVSQAHSVISQRVIPNPKAEEALRNSAGAFANAPISCPVIRKDQDPDPKREHTTLFPMSLYAMINPEKVNQTYICEYSGKAVDHWNRVSEDVALIKNLNVQWYRFSIEWAKIEPEKGQYNQEALNHYIKEIKELQLAGIEPHITLFHFTMPQWLRDEGGWESSQSPGYFRNFTRKVYKEFAKANIFIPVWYTLNEPMVHISAGYLAGVLPPGEKNPLKLTIVLTNILQAHALSYRELHFLANSPEYRQNNIRVGIAHHLRVFEPLEDLDVGEKLLAYNATFFIDYAWNWMFIDAIETGTLLLSTQILKDAGIPVPYFFNNIRIVNKTLKGTQDFLGLNYYSRDRVQVSLDSNNPISLLVDPTAKKTNQLTDMKWEIYPEGMYKITKALHQRIKTVGERTLPIIISENGIADSSDVKRITFIKEHLKFLKQAMDEGVPVEGYCYWSLLDNYEWNSGYYPQFGLYEVDLKQNMKRTARGSANFFSDLAKTNGF
jgi:beta-glucosidase